MLVYKEILGEKNDIVTYWSALKLSTTEPESIDIVHF